MTRSCGCVGMPYLCAEVERLRAVVMEDLLKSTELAVRVDLLQHDLTGARRDYSGLRRAWLQLCDLVDEWGRGAPDQATATQLVVEAVRRIKEERDQLRRETR